MESNWTTRDGVEMHTSEMTESHAQNTLNMFIRQVGVKVVMTIVADALKVQAKEVLEEVTRGNIEDCFKEEEMNEQANDFDEDHGINDYTGGGI
tara:strand:+ start:1371 stop:1652 length:282 start_codon:yes stop_codon:yes gene_type:complete